MNKWLEWIDDGNATKRKLIVQVINAMRLSYKWNSLKVSLQNLELLRIVPATSPEAIKQAVELCNRLNWNAKAIRDDFR